VKSFGARGRGAAGRPASPPRPGSQLVTAADHRRVRGSRSPAHQARGLWDTRHWFNDL